MIKGPIIAFQSLGPVDAAVDDLVRSEYVSGSWYINLPLTFPDGSFVTVRVEKRGDDLFRVSDHGFAYREIDDIEASRSFRRTANPIVENAGLILGDRAVYVDVPPQMLHRAICDVAEASWRIVDKIFERVFLDEDEEALAEALTLRLVSLFGSERVEVGAKVIGVSTNEWDVSAVVRFPDHTAIFQAVGTHANSIYRASTEFRDLAGLKKQPRIIGVVKSKEALGQKITLLTPARVLEATQADELFAKAAA